jgi:hypothetical protein
MRWGVHWTAERCAQPCRRLPRRKEERLALATSYYERLLRRSRAGQVNGVIVGLGQMPCELLTGASRISLKANCSWEHPEFGHVWVTFSPDYAIATDMALLPDISATFTLAGREYGIETRFDERLREPPPKFKRLCYGFCQVGSALRSFFVVVKFDRLVCCSPRMPAVASGAGSGGAESPSTGFVFLLERFLFVLPGEDCFLPRAICYPPALSENRTPAL